MLLYLVEADASSSTFQWVMFLLRKYSGMFLEGTLTTLYIAVVGTVFGLFVGLLVGIIQDAVSQPTENKVRKAVNFVLKAITTFYVELFRGTPMIVQGMVVYYGLRQANIEISPLAAGMIVMVLNTGAYMAETVRSGVNSISSGQREGALAMGVSPMGAMISVVLPQAMKNIMPEIGNNFLTNLKMTSVLNVIGVSELFYTAKTAGGTYYKYFEAYLAIASIYLVLCFICSRLIALLEKGLEGKKDYVLAAEYM